jgi:Tfp pilus assembly protein PilN
MINLLPGDYRTALRLGRTNARLRHWIEIGVLLIVGLGLILGVGWLYINQQVNNLNSSIAATQKQLETQHLEEVQKQADQISQNIRIINQVLSRELRFSALIQEIGRVMPDGTVLGSLTLSNKIKGALDLTVSAKSHVAAAQVAVNLSDPKNNIFAKVDIISINCSTQSGASSGYLCTGSYRALFDSKTPNRFLNIPNNGGRS